MFVFYYYTLSLVLTLPYLLDNKLYNDLLKACYTTTKAI